MRNRRKFLKEGALLPALASWSWREERVYGSASRLAPGIQGSPSTGFKVTLQGPFVISDQRRHPGWVHFHAHMSRLPGGRLLLTIGKERDIVDQERFLLTSDDNGKTWSDSDEAVWPPARFPGFGSSHWAYLTLDDRTILNYLNMSFTTRENGVYQLPMWVSRDGGQTWGPMQAARAEIPGLSDLDHYNPSDEWRQRLADYWEKGFVKREPPHSMRELFQRFGTERGRASWEQIIKLSDDRLLGLISAFPEDRLAEVVAVQSQDRGKTWKFLSIVARHDAKYLDTTLAVEPNGFCEPSAVRFSDGELLVVMRMGSFHPLYAVRSQDGGRTWTEPQKLTSRSVQPKLVMMHNGALALGTGRPHEIVSFSLDQGYSWPYRVYLPDDGVQGAHCSANSYMLEVEPNRLLFVYCCYNRDEGGADPWLRSHGHGRTLGCFIEVKIDENGWDQDR